MKYWTVKIPLDYKNQFEELYVSYYSRMKRFAQEYVIREEDAENIVQDVFLELWERKQFLPIHTNLFAYLFTTIKNKCIDFLRHKTIVQQTKEKIQDDHWRTLQMKLQSLEAFNEQLFSEPEIEILIQNAINSLPEKCREIFILNKIDGIKQKDIATKLNISVNTVESQMAIAYKKLKEALKDHPLLLIAFFI